MFGRTKKSTEEASEPTTHGDSTSGKGRPTPSRRDAEEARKQQLRIPSDPKAAKKAARERDRVAREEQRRGMMNGDPRYLPTRDQGPVRAFARDFVDARFSLAEYFVFVAIGVLLLGFIQNQAVQTVITLGFYIFTAIMAIDIVIVLIQLRSAVAKQFPDESRKGLAWYAGLRLIQMRRLRLPAPRVRIGGRPR